MNKRVVGSGVTPRGIYLLARCYHEAADIVTTGHRLAFSDHPSRLLYLHAAETYLRCFLRFKEYTPEKVRAFNHHLGELLDEAVGLGLIVSPKATKYLRSVAEENDYVRVRYDINIRPTSWPPPKRTRTIALSGLQTTLLELQSSVENGLREAGFSLPKA